MAPMNGRADWSEEGPRDKNMDGGAGWGEEGPRDKHMDGGAGWGEEGPRDKSMDGVQAGVRKQEGRGLRGAWK